MLGLRSRLPGTRYGGIVAGFLGVAMVLGGGGSPSAAAEILVQLTFAVAVIAWLMWAPQRRTRVGTIPRELLALAAMLALIPLLQLIPLPPTLWQSLPGRALEMQTLALVGEADSWRPISLAPYHTLAGLLALIPALGVMLATATLGQRDRRFLLLVIGAIAIAGAALGALQIAGGADAFRLYEKSHRGWLTAFHANRNAAADALLIGAMALTAWFATRPASLPRQQSSVIVLLALQALLLIAAVLTGSRAGIALIPVAMLVQLAMLKGSGLGTLVRRAALGAAALFAALLALPYVLASNVRLAGVAARFDAVKDFRQELWTDTLFALQTYWPAGSGLGTFVTAFLPAERIEVVDPTFPNRAHNDYLEFLLEAGLLAPLVLVAGAILLFLLARRALAAEGEARINAIFALGTLVVIALHSIVDYPLRNMAIACLAGVAAGLLGTRPSRGSAEHTMGAEA
ncbi:O-antigen ligase family protein [Qipengyuania marisflavi]|uniref:O-antigen ligase family protein n=1 Tax=Qipengyuania marisflavi TaxID=2486356 RepID=A0A5S3PFR8_9SPHN|nr:O-antigen ligase family protein [Qipengyuania marisflavi]TMM50430.1 O-antigen ligase family protein [Qipengyuania marisflavi]